MNGEDQVQDDIIEQEQRRQFAQAQMQERAEKQKAGGLGGKMIGAAGKALGSKEGMEKFEKALGKGVKKIKTSEHSMTGWIIALVLAVVKDLLDIGTIELASGIDWIVDIIIGVIMFYLFGKSIKLARRLITSAGAMIAEIIPGLGFLPIWTLAVVYMYLKSQQEE